MKKFQTLAAVLVVALVTACAGPSKSTTDDAAAGTAENSGAASSGVGDSGMGQGGAMGDTAGGSALGGPGASQENRIIYFDLDRFDIKPEYNEILKAHARYLSGNSSARVRLEGHGDERGSREYNIGLGEKRAQAVRNVLLLQGAVSDQINTVSFGEERPAVIGSDEEAWSLNRRVEIVYGQ
ncbi:MAG: peptidoglycan-associated lipoprotein Pal [Gammaproteobacteria bacterium]